MSYDKEAEDIYVLSTISNKGRNSFDDMQPIPNIAKPSVLLARKTDEVGASSSSDSDDDYAEPCLGSRIEGVLELAAKADARDNASKTHKISRINMDNIVNNPVSGKLITCC